MPPIKAVAFDLDGLMVNTEELYHEVGDTMLQRRGKRVTPELLSTMMGRKNVDALQVMIDWHQLEDTVDQLLIENDEILYQLVEERLEALPGVMALLDRLESKQIPKAITTSGRAHYVEKVLSQLGIGDRFAFRITAEDVSDGKPHPEIYLTAAKRFGIDNSKMAVLEDSDLGCQAGVAAGSVVIAVPSAMNETLPFAGAAVRVANLADSAVFEILGIE
jgi:HAD superfamily hydrolase (TIGR01509 family)